MALFIFWYFIVWTLAVAFWRQRAARRLMQSGLESESMCDEDAIRHFNSALAQAQNTPAYVRWHPIDTVLEWRAQRKINRDQQEVSHERE